MNKDIKTWQTPKIDAVLSIKETLGRVDPNLTSDAIYGDRGGS